ncbi:MAG: Cob(I)yrinic acid a,c-diamide adenosyltransferase [Pelotomaculum sp. PtaB.Bin013]|uniref:Cob(I)yrinic acid a,c-diamide adenosyltransferase n=1 Tax=Pelotomaculum isophthalicicum JI TaxID=947010 RepID=A0A9X4H0B6_9FIRM|nr:cob(I)yrinic acid a,c-diamide adenosyltransferase [Pelotomaculum isophthalicicum]MDF9407095.1 cob(I)yrinic acid a,c-diamide adenosyltransferase [Pelotomaculum isophthalicicum JI]OPX91158.1 MAG: Cob(I)yrinic acid a,c-diamide adenosyltransferase [Pelotomaculum sp. PtaB.Bin013]
MDREKGLLLVNTGDGKGKTTAALGMALRAWGQGMKVLILQFIKGDRRSGEIRAVEKLGPGFEIWPMGKGFIHNNGEEFPDRHSRAAREALNVAVNEMNSGKYDLIILDEILYALHYGLVSIEDVLALIAGKPERLHLMLTGRYAPPEIIRQADLVTEMKEIKHPFTKGVYAQMGIEY